MLIDCPNCSRKMYLSTRFDVSRCSHCRQTVTSPSKFLPTKDHLPESHYQAFFELRRAKQAQRQQDRPREIRALKQAVHYNPRLLHAHIRLGRLLPDPRDRRRHLMAARRIDPENMEAITLLAELQTTLSPQEAVKLFGDDAPVKASSSVMAQSVEMQCPVCRGALHGSPKDNLLECAFCGYSERFESQFVTQQRTVREQLVENISGTLWEIDEYVSSCSNCGARWAHETQLSTMCPYCNTALITVSDEVGSFLQPHGVIPFEVTEQQALAAISSRLERFSERLKGIFNPNAIKRAVLNAVYLPFWVFDENIDLQMQVEFDVVGFKHHSVDPRVVGQGSSYDLGISAVRTIPSQMTQQLDRYYRNTMIPYKPGVLDHPAEIYDVDLNRALLRARTIIARAMTSKVAMRYKQIYITDFSRTNYQLILAPVWLGTLYEVDGDIRPALVNGQVGKVILGKARKS